MAWTYPLPWVGIVPQLFTFRSAVAVGVTRMPMTFETQAFKHAGEQWQFEAEFAPMRGAAAGVLAAWLLKLQGKFGTFLCSDLGNRRLGTPTGTPVVAQTGYIGNELPTRGWTPSSVNNLAAGDYLQLGAGQHARLHRVLERVDADAGGLATVEIWPAVKRLPGLNDGDPLIVDSPQGVFRSVENAAEWRAAPGDVTRGLVLAAQSEP